MAVRAHHDVVRLEVAVHDAGLMGAAERFADLDGGAQRVAQHERPALDQRAQRAALDQLHGDEHHAVRLVHLVDRGDVGMGHRGGGPRLAQEAQPALFVVHPLPPQDLEGDTATELLVLGGVNLAHSALADLRQDAEVG